MTAHIAVQSYKNTFYRRGIYFQNHATPWTYNFRTVSRNKNEEEVMKYLRTNYSDGRNGCEGRSSFETQKNDME